MPYRIEKIICEGFRGFREKRELGLEQELIILCGPQRSGKSSVLNAPVWALIGPDMAKLNLGPVKIRERVGWLVENLEARDCKVEITLRGTDNTMLTIERRKGRDNYVVRRDGNNLSKDPLGSLGLSIDGLVSSVFLPQEMVRAALSVEPQNRKAIFTQLAGLEDLRALEECIKKASETLKKSNERVVRCREDIDTGIKFQVATQKKKIGQLIERLHELGLSTEDISPDGVKALAGQSVTALKEFCKEYQMETPTLPEVCDVDDLLGFVEGVRMVLSRFEAQSPEMERQGKLYKKKHIIEDLTAQQQEIETERERINDERQKIVQTHGTEEKLRLALKQDKETLDKINEEIREAGRYQTMIQEALTYFETLPKATAEIECPICRQTRVTVAHVREHLVAEIARAGLEPLRERKNKIEDELERKLRARKRLQQLAEDEKQLAKKQDELIRKVSELRGQPFGEHESARRVLDSMILEIDNELKGLQVLLEARGKAIQDVRAKLDKLGIVGNLHQERQRLKELDGITNLPDYRALIEVEKRAELQIGFLSELQRGMNDEVEQAFRNRFAALKEKVNAFYRKLVGREDFPEIWIDTENWEVLAGADENGTGVTRIFNIGDMTAVALCLFLASASRASHDAGFILLDDPAQNLDDEHEKRLADILAELAKERQIIVTSSRTSFLELLKNAGTVKRQVIRLAPWDSDRSIQFSRDNT